MVYPFLTLRDDTEIVHSEKLSDGRVKVYIETPDDKDCFHHMTCYLPNYEVTEVYGYSDAEVDKFMKIIQSTAHLIMEFSETGGFANASGI